VVFVNVPASFGRLAASQTLIFSWLILFVQSVRKSWNGGYERPTEYAWGDAAKPISAFALVY